MASLTIRWWGHACFSISDGQLIVLTDPFPKDFGYQSPDVEPHVVLISHDHFDHNALDNVRGQPLVVKGEGKHQAAGLEFLGVRSYHDPQRGAQRGLNTIFAWRMAGLTLVHCGDLGTILNEEQIVALSPPVDILMIPVGGHYTIDAAEAVRVAQQLQARLILPMHVRTKALTKLPIAPVDDFLKAVPADWEIQRPSAPELTISAGDLPTAHPRVIALPYE